MGQKFGDGGDFTGSVTATGSISPGNGTVVGGATWSGSTLPSNSFGSDGDEYQVTASADIGIYQKLAGTWTKIGGGGSPGGSSGEIQYNNDAVFGGDTATTDGAGNITATSVSNYPASSTTPAFSMGVAADSYVRSYIDGSGDFITGGSGSSAEWNWGISSSGFFNWPEHADSLDDGQLPQASFFVLNPISDTGTRTMPTPLATAGGVNAGGTIVWFANISGYQANLIPQVGWTINMTSTFALPGGANVGFMADTINSNWIPISTAGNAVITGNLTVEGYIESGVEYLLATGLVQGTDGGAGIQMTSDNGSSVVFCADYDTTNYGATAGMIAQWSVGNHPFLFQVNTVPAGGMQTSGTTFQINNYTTPLLELDYLGNFTIAGISQAQGHETLAVTYSTKVFTSGAEQQINTSQDTMCFIPITVGAGVTGTVNIGTGPTGAETTIISDSDTTVAATSVTHTYTVPVAAGEYLVITVANATIGTVNIKTL